MNFYVNIDLEYDVSKQVGQIDDFDQLMADIERLYEERVVMDKSQYNFSSQRTERKLNKELETLNGKLSMLENRNENSCDSLKSDISSQEDDTDDDYV